MSVEYYIFDPNGNVTALVTGGAAKPGYTDISKRIMADNPGVEQVGFVDFSNKAVNLNMAGDEFCGNAAMSAAALNYRLLGKSGVLKQTVLVSPLNAAVEVTVRGEGDEFFCESVMPFPDKISEYSFTAGGREYKFPIVHLSGITHIIADNSLSPAYAQSVIKALAKDLAVPALGIMLFDRAPGRLVPLVYVAAVDTVFFEKCCSSGTCAVARICSRRV